MTTKQIKALKFIQMGIKNGHIKCKPFINTNDDAEQIEIKSVGQLVDEALSDAEKHCPYCDNTGIVHSITGEWYGVCSCKAALSNENTRLRNGMAAMTAVIEYAITDSDCDQFLKLWLHGDFDVLRREWPDAPAAIYEGQL